MFNTEKVEVSRNLLSADLAYRNTR